jgi:hypothetical protein
MPDTNGGYMLTAWQASLSRVYDMPLRKPVPAIWAVPSKPAANAGRESLPFRVLTGPPSPAGGVLAWGYGQRE